MWGVPEKWGFIRDLRECVGKTIEAVELTDLGFGYTIQQAWVVRFTDGTRAFFGERPSKGTALCPSEKAIGKSLIFKPEELADVVADRMQKNQERERRERQEDLRKLTELQQKYARSPQETVESSDG